MRYLLFVLALLCTSAQAQVTQSTVNATPVSAFTGVSPLANSIAGNVSLNNTANFFDGPIIAQGTVGTWFVSGSVSLVDTGGAATFNAKLWDGTTVVSSGRCTGPGAGQYCVIALSGVITNPAASLRISAQDVNAITGLIAANASGGGKDSTITAYRIN
jgi:hypothetical protein